MISNEHFAYHRDALDTARRIKALARAAAALPRANVRLGAKQVEVLRLTRLALGSRMLEEKTRFALERVLQSFRRADLVIEASDGGEPCYIAVEASYTADWHDVDRAARNARLLARFTGRSGHAVVAGVHQHGSAEAGLESGRAHWYALFEPDLLPE